MAVKKCSISLGCHILNLLVRFRLLQDELKRLAYFHRDALRLVAHEVLVEHALMSHLPFRASKKLAKDLNLVLALPKFTSLIILEIEVDEQHSLLFEKSLHLPTSEYTSDLTGRIPSILVYLLSYAFVQIQV